MGEVYRVCNVRLHLGRRPITPAPSSAGSSGSRPERIGQHPSLSSPTGRSCSRGTKARLWPFASSR